ACAAGCAAPDRRARRLHDDSRLARLAVLRIHAVPAQGRRCPSWQERAIRSTQAGSMHLQPLSEPAAPASRLRSASEMSMMVLTTDGRKPREDQNGKAVTLNHLWLAERSPTPDSWASSR